jgi:hypothetical protein
MLFYFSFFFLVSFPIYVLFFIQISYCSFLNLIDFVVHYVFLCSNIPSRFFISFFDERNKTTPMRINILICFMGLMF